MANKNYRITDELIAQVKTLSATITKTKIAERFGISGTTVTRIIDGNYDTGRLVRNSEKVKRYFFNYKERKNWLV